MMEIEQAVKRVVTGMVTPTIKTGSVTRVHGDTVNVRIANSVKLLRGVLVVGGVGDIAIGDTVTLTKIDGITHALSPNPRKTNPKIVYTTSAAGGSTVVGGTPTFTFDTSGAEGSNSSFVRTDAQVALFDITAPADVVLAAATGSAGKAARRDHIHAIDESIVPTWTGLHTFSDTPVSIDVAQGIRHQGDTDTYIAFTANQIDLNPGGVATARADATTLYVLPAETGKGTTGKSMLQVGDDNWPISATHSYATGMGLSIDDLSASQGFYAGYWGVQNTTSGVTPSFVAGLHTQIQSTRTVGTIEGLAGVAKFNNTTDAQTATHLRALYLEAGSASAGTKTIANEQGVWLRFDHSAGGAVTVSNDIIGQFIDFGGTHALSAGDMTQISAADNLYGIYIASPSAGTYTNEYGIYIEEVDQGSTLNRSIFAVGTTELVRNDGPQLRIGYDTSTYVNMQVISGGDFYLNLNDNRMIFTNWDTHTSDGLQSNDYTSQTTGWAITYPGDIDFRYGFFDELHAKAFVADLEQALAGGQIICKSVAILYSDFTMPYYGDIIGVLPASDYFVVDGDQTGVIADGDEFEVTGSTGNDGRWTVSSTNLEVGPTTRIYTVEDITDSNADGYIRVYEVLAVEDLPGASNMEVFEDDDFVSVRQFSRAGGSLSITFAWGTVSGASTAPSGYQTWDWLPDQTTPGAMTIGDSVEANGLALDWGTSGYGYLEQNAIDGSYGINSPYIQTVKWTGHPYTGRVVRTRTGNLRGVTGNNNEFGMYAGSGHTSDDNYVVISDQEVALHNLDLSIYDGANTVIALDYSTPYLGIGNPAPTQYGGTDEGFWVGNSGGGTYKLRIGDPAGHQLAWDGSNLYVMDSTSAYVQMAGNGIEMVGNSAVRVKLSATGVLTLGASGENQVTASSAGGIQIKDSSGNTLISLGSSGNAIFGQVATDYGNAFWNSGNQRLEFRGGTSGTTVEAYIDTDGSISAGGGYITMNTQGLNVEIGSSYTDPRSIKLVDSSGTVYSYLQGLTTPENQLRLMADSIGGLASTVILTASCPTGDATVQIVANRSGAGYAQINMIGDSTTNQSRIELNNAPVLLSEIPYTPSTTTADVECKYYFRNGYFIIKYNDSGTTRYKYLDLTGTGTSWAHGTSEPT